MYHMCTSHIYGINLKQKNKLWKKIRSYFRQYNGEYWCIFYKRDITVTDNGQFDCEQYVFQQNISIFSTKMSHKNA